MKINTGQIVHMHTWTLALNTLWFQWNRFRLDSTADKVQNTSTPQFMVNSSSFPKYLFERVNKVVRKFRVTSRMSNTNTSNYSIICSNALDFIVCPYQNITCNFYIIFEKFVHLYYLVEKLLWLLHRRIQMISLFSRNGIQMCCNYCIDTSSECLVYELNFITAHWNYMR